MVASLTGLLLVASAFGAAPTGPIKTGFDTDGAITVNGARTLIIGSYHAGNKYTAPKPTAELYKELADAGFNLVSASGADAQLAHAAGLMTWTSVGTLDPKDREKTTQALKDRVSAAKGQAGLAFLESVDEPAWTWMKAEQRVPAQAFVDAYPLIKQVDPDHLLYLNHAPTNLVKTLQAYNPGTDIVAADIYPVNPGGLKPQYALFEDGMQGDLLNTYVSQVGEYTDKMRKVAGPNRPVFMVLQAFAWEMLNEPAKRDEKKVLYPSYDDSRFMAFQALIHGANGLMYWGSYHTPQPSQCWTDIKRVVREVADLSGPLAEPSDPIKPAVDYLEMGRDVDAGIQCVAKRHKGKLYLFTCNADKNPCKAVLSGFGPATACKVLNENRTLPIENGAITDTWRRFDVHIYELAP